MKKMEEKERKKFIKELKERKNWIYKKIISKRKKERKKERKIERKKFKRKFR